MKVHCMRGKGGELIVGNPRRVDFQKDRDKGKQCQCVCVSGAVGHI